MRPSTTAAALAAPLLLALAAPAATAEVLTVEDAADNPDGVEVTAMRTAYKDRLRIVLEHEGLPDDAAVEATYWLDTKPRNRGPEYRIRVAANSDVMLLEGVDRWNDDGKRQKCKRLSAKADAFSDDPIVVRVHGACLGDPAKVRVAARVKQVRAGEKAEVDWVPDKHTYTPWVRRH